MICIEVDNRFKHIIEAPEDNSKIIIKGPTGSGKSTILLERYIYMVEKLNIPSEKILILLLNRTQSLDWRAKTFLKSSSAIWRTSYYGFIQNELKIFYPIVLKNCGSILDRRIKPTFLTFESAQFLVSTVIKSHREKKGIFAGVASYTDRISIDLTSNLVKAATSGISYDQIGNRLFNSLEIKDDIKKQVFMDADNITRAYRNKCIELGVFDFGMAVDLYNSCLMTDDAYKEQLRKRVQHLIIDNLEECVPTEVDFIESVLPNVKSCLLGYNYEGGYGEIFGSNHKYVKERLIDKCKIIDLNNSYTCKSFMYEFSDMIFENIDGQKQSKASNGADIERNSPAELRSEMLEMVGDRIIRLIREEGYVPCDIAILSTYADPVTEFVIGRILERYGYSLRNYTRKSRVIDNPFSQALITLAELCHPNFNLLPNRDNVRALIRLILRIDPIRSSILAEEICRQKPYAKFPDIEFPGLVERIGYYNIEKYEYIRNWIDEYRNQESALSIDAFLQKVFLEILVSSDLSDNDILQAKNLIDSAQSFVEIVSRFKNISADKGFLEMVRSGIKAAESIYELEEKIDSNTVILTTPVAYLSCSINSKILILTSLSSKNWTPRSIKELTNVHVLTKTWDEKSIYTEELEEVNQREYLAMLIRAVIKRCGHKLITFESVLSANGFENDGILSEYFDEILK
ncbi:MAG: hypothetical protein Q8942_11855 [Bacillota bacterium]|nr:hypothetical protein [Bacillota bacterium]